MYKNISVTKVVFVTSMNYNTTEKDLRNFFASCGEITNIRLLYDKNNEFSGSAYVAFDSHEAALKAYAKDDTCLRDRFLRVSLNRTDAIEEIMTKKQSKSNDKQQNDESQNNLSEDHKPNKIDTNKNHDHDVPKKAKSDDKQGKPRKEPKHHHRHEHHGHHKHHKHKRHNQGNNESSDEGIRYYSELPE